MAKTVYMLIMLDYDKIKTMFIHVMCNQDMGDNFIMHYYDMGDNSIMLNYDMGDNSIVFNLIQEITL